MPRGFAGAIIAAGAAACLVATLDAYRHGDTRLWIPEDLPNPMTNPEACGQSQQSAICDPDGVLGLQAARRLQSAAAALEADHKYPSCGGYEMAVLVVRRVKGGSEEAVKRIARRAMDNWGVGKTACKNGIVLAAAIDDRHLSIVTGRGAKEHVSDSELEAIIERMKPLLRNHQHADAAEQCISDIARVLKGESFKSNVDLYIAFACIAPIAALFMYYDSRRTRNYERCRRALEQIDYERAQASAERYQVVSCAICLTTFAETPNLAKQLLQCGHSFHKSCIDGWVVSHGLCPVCRAPTSEDRCGRRTTAAAARDPRGYEQEYSFRIRRARTLYPDYVSDSMVSDWTCPTFTGSLTADAAFIRNSPSYGDSSSSCFGGGDSDGGGCACGSW